MATLCRLDVFLLFTFLNIISNSRYKTDYSAVLYRTAEYFYEFAMTYGIKEAFKV